MMSGPIREDSKVVGQGELWNLWNQDSNQPCWASLSLAFCLPSWQFLPSSLSFPSILSLFSASLPCFLLSLLSHSLIPFCLSSLTLSVSVFILLPSFPFSATLSLFPTFFCLLFFLLFNSSLSFL